MKGKLFNVQTLKNNAIIAAIIIAIFAAFGIKSVVSEKTARITDPVLLKSLEYAKLTDDQIYAENTETHERCENVTFAAFFPKDIDGDGYDERLLGSCEDGALMYIDIGVSNGGRLENGKIEIDGKNFDLRTAELEDDVLLHSYVSTDTKEILLKTVQAGTQKLIRGNIKTTLGTVEDFSKVSEVTLTGTYIPDEGDPIEIKKVINLTVDILGDNATTSIKLKENSVNKSTGHIESNKNYVQTIKFTTIQSGLISKEHIVNILVKPLAGVYPESVNVDIPEEEYEYDEENHLIKIDRLSDNNVCTYEVMLTYPKELYNKINDSNESVFRSNIIIRAHHICYSNPNSEGGPEYQTEEVSTIFGMQFNKPSDDPPLYAQFYLDVDIKDEGTEVSSSSDLNRVKEMPKNEFLEEYDNTDEHTSKKLGYDVVCHITKTYGDVTPTTIQISSIGDDFDGVNLEDYLKIESVSISGSLTYGTKFNVYDYDTNELIGENRSNGLISLEQPVKNLKIETTKEYTGSDQGELIVTFHKVFDIEKMKNEISRSQIENIESYNTTVSGTGNHMSNLLTAFAHLNYVTEKSKATLSVTPDSLDFITDEATRHTFNIEIPNHDIHNAAWTNGIFEISIPKSKYTQFNLLRAYVCNRVGQSQDVPVNAFVSSDENNYYVRIETNENISGLNIIVEADAMQNPEITATRFPINLQYKNAGCEVYDNQAVDTNDIDKDGNTNDYVGVDSAEIKVVSPSSFMTYEYVSNFDDNNSTVYAPNIAKVSKEARSATVNINLYNGSTAEQSNFVVVGRTPAEGNTYVDGDSMNSNFTAAMSSQGIVIPEELAGHVTVYYSTKADADKDLNNTENGWTAASDVQSFSNIKSYMVMIDNGAINYGHKYKFSYDISIPQGIASNYSSYSVHKVYYDVNSATGLYSTSVQPRKTGIRVTRFYDMELEKCKEGTDLPIAYTKYSVFGNYNDDQESISGETDSNGKVTLQNLIVNQEYTLSEVSANSCYERNTETTTFVVEENESGELSINVKSGNLLNPDKLVMKKNSQNKDVLASQSKLEDTPKYMLIINKVDSNNNKLAGTKFDLISDHSSSCTTDEVGQCSISELSFSKEYTIHERQNENYYKIDDITFTINKNGETFTVNSESKIMQDAIITNPANSDLVIVEITIVNEQIPSYGLKIIKENADDENEKLSNATFVLERADMNDSMEYTTGNDGTFTINNMFLSVEEKNISGEYTLWEAKAPSAPKAFIRNKEQIKFVVSKNDQGNLQVAIDNENNLTSVKDYWFEENTLVIEIVDYPIFELTKVDSETSTPLANVDFVIYELDENGDIIGFAKDMNDEYVGVQNDKGDYIVTTDSNGKIGLAIAKGTYKVMEYNYPEGYIENANTEVFTIGYKWQKYNWTGDVPIQAIKPNISEPSVTIAEPTQTIEINYIEDLVNLQINVSNNTYSGTEIKLNRDLDFNNNDSYQDPTSTALGDVNNDGKVDPIKTELTTSKGFYPIGANSPKPPFCGTFNGQNHTISNLYENNSSTNCGLFGVLYNGSIKNLTVTGTITTDAATANMGGICGFAYGQNLVENCTNKCNITSSNSSGPYAGGIIGSITRGSTTVIKNCINDGTVCWNAEDNQGKGQNGGIVGNISEGTRLLCDGCTNKKQVAGYNVGGIIGYSINGAGAYIKGSTNEGNVYGNTVGGIIGYSTSGQPIMIYDSENKGNVQASMYAAGIIANRNDGLYLENVVNSGIVTGGTYAAGIVCYMYESSGSTGSQRIFYKCKNKGNVSGGSDCGGIIADDEATKSQLFIDSTFNYNKITGGSIYSGGLVGVSTANSVYIQNCGNEGEIELSNSGSYSGGIAGRITNGTVSNTYNTGNITGKQNESSSSYVIGGIAGQVSSITFVNDYNTGNIDVKNVSQVGGILGFSTASSGSCMNCYNEGNINVEDAYTVSGIIGQASGYSVKDCYNEGSIEVSSNKDLEVSGIGGLASSYSNCFNTGNITASTASQSIYVGGISSRANNITKCWNIGVIDADSHGGYIAIGGIVGSGGSTCTYCTNDGYVKAKGGYGYVAGIAGASGSVTNGWNLADIDVTTSTNSQTKVAGITASGTAKYSYNEGKIQCTAEAPISIGGITGSGSAEEVFNKGDIVLNGKLVTDTYSNKSLVGGISGSGDVTNGVNYGNIYSSPISGNGAQKIGSISGSGTVTSSYDTGNVYSFVTGSVSAESVTNAISDSTSNVDSYITDAAIVTGPNKSEPNGTVCDDSYMKTHEFYNKLASNSESWMYMDGKYPILNLSLLSIPYSSKRITMTNTKQSFDILTEVGLNANGERIGGSLSGTYNDKYKETDSSTIKFVETVEYNGRSTENIVVTPDAGYAIRRITINNEDYNFEVDENGVCTIPAGYLKNIKKNYTITGYFAPVEKILTITKTDMGGNPLEGAKFKIEQVDETSSTDLLIAEHVTNVNGQIKVELAYGKYKVTEIEAPQGYILNGTPQEITLSGGDDNVLTFVNQEKSKVITHYILKGTGPNRRTRNSPRLLGSSEPVELADNEIQFGIVGSEYITTPKLAIVGDDNHVYTLERDTNGKFVIPENAKGVYADDTINVYYNYERNTVEYKVHYIYDGDEDEDALETISVSEGTVINREDVALKDKDGYYLYTIDNVPLEVKSDNVSNDIYVRYGKRTYNYSIHYFYQGVEDETKAVTDIPAFYGSEISDYEDKSIEGYHFARARALDENGEETELPLVIKSNNEYNVINIYYELDGADYTVHYFYDGIEDESKKVTSSAVLGSKITEVPNKDRTGYKRDHTEGLPLTISAAANENVVNVYYVKDSFDYTIHFFYEGTEDTSRKITRNAVFESVITAENIASDVNTNKKDGYKHDRTEGVPLTISSNAENNVINVYYVKDSYNYTIHFFYEGTEDTSRKITRSAVFERVITAEDIASDVNANKIEGYKHSITEGLPLTISSNPANNVINVYYIIDELGYSIHFFYDEVEDTSKVINNNAPYGSAVTAGDIASYVVANRIDGYKHDRTEVVPLTISSDTNANIINVYYVKDNFDYTIHFFYDEVEDVSKAITRSAVFGSIITAANIEADIETNKVTGYNYNRTEGVPLTISSNPENNVINVYYSRIPQGKVIVKYVDNLTGESVREDTTMTGQIGTGYTATRITISGYKLDLDNLPTNETGTYQLTPQTVTYKYIKLCPYELVVRYSSGEGENDEAKIGVRFGDTFINEYTTNGELKIADIELTDLGTENYTVYETETPEYCTTVVSEEHPAVVELTRRLNTEARKYEFVANYENIEGFKVIVDEQNKKVIFDITAKKDIKYDLALRKFITKIDDQEITDRVPQVLVSADNKITYVGNDNIEKARNNQNITYTIRMYNESEIKAKGKRIVEYVPEGLVFVPSNEINRRYNWKMYKQGANGEAVEVTNAEEATIVVTDYLVGKDIKAFNPETKEVSYLDVQAVFKVDESKITRQDRIVENKVQIVPNENDDNTDNDVTTEKVYIQYFDLSVEKYIEEVVINTNGTEETRKVGYEQKGNLVKVDVKKSEAKNTKLTITYGILVKNVGEIPGYATEITDYIPEDFELLSNDEWTINGNKAVSTTLSDKLLNPGESATLEVTFEWDLASGNVGTRRNEAEITEYANDFDAEDVTKDNKDGEDILVTLKTGSEQIAVVTAIAAFTTVVALGVLVIKRKMK